MGSASPEDQFLDKLVAAKTSFVDNAQNLGLSDIAYKMGTSAPFPEQDTINNQAQTGSTSNTNFQGYMQAALDTTALNLGSSYDNPNFQVAFEAGSYGSGKSLTLMNHVVDYAGFLAKRVDDNLTSAVNTLALPMTNALDADMDKAIAEVQRGFTVAHGFFNTNIVARVQEVRDRFAREKAKVLAELTFEYRRHVDNSGLGALQVIAGYRNQPLNEKLEIEKFRLMLLAQLTSINYQGLGLSTQAFVQKLAYAQNESAILYRNLVGKYHRLSDAARWEAEIISLLANQTGTPRKPGWATALETVAGGVMTAAGIGAMFLPGGQGVGAAMAGMGASKVATALG